jgi:predicted secreted protein
MYESRIPEMPNLKVRFDASILMNPIDHRSVFCLMLEITSSTNHIRLHAGDRFKLILDENPTTGFRWTITERDESKCSLIEEKQESVSPLPGSPSQHTWTFECKIAGETELALALKQSWRADSAKEFRLSIIVED